jgi:hypothetical protein
MSSDDSQSTATTGETGNQVRPWYKKKRVMIPLVLIVLFVIGVATSGGNKNGKSTTSTTMAVSASSSTTAKPYKTTTTAAPTTTTVPVRKVEGATTTLGAGTFTGGQDVPSGLYDVTPGSGQSGNFQVSGDDSYNEILGGADGLGVSKVRAKISNGDQITISNLSKVTFSPVSAPLVTAYGPQTLYAGTFTVGEDIAPGRYVATPGSGESGNFQVFGDDEYNEILGGPNGLGVPNVTVTVKKGDVIAISGLSQVNMNPAS